MASLNSEIILSTSEYRPCRVDGKKALFHKWNENCNVIGESIMRGGHSGGQIKYTLGLIEFEDGTMEEVSPTKIIFSDCKFQEFAFKEN